MRLRWLLVTVVVALMGITASIPMAAATRVADGGTLVDSRATLTSTTACATSTGKARFQQDDGQGHRTFEGEVDNTCLQPGTPVRFVAGGSLMGSTTIQATGGASISVARVASLSAGAQVQAQYQDPVSGWLTFASGTLH